MSERVGYAPQISEELSKFVTKAFAQCAFNGNPWEIHGKSLVMQGPGWLPKDKGTSRILEAGAGIRHFPCLSRGYSTVIPRMLPRIS